MPALGPAIALAIWSLTTAAYAATIPLRPGDYGATSLACDNEPNAGIVSFERPNFSYPHETRCTDRVTRRSGDVLSISETCRAQGDGTPIKPMPRKFRIKVLGPERFGVLVKGGLDEYRRCGDLNYFANH